MELEELKNAWTSVDERLKKQEILKESIIREIVYKKANKSLNALLWSEFIGIPIILTIIPFIVWAYKKHGGRVLTWDILALYALLFCIVYFPYLLYKAYLLVKIDLAESIKSNLSYINKFGVVIKKEKIAMSILYPIFVILMVPMLIEFRANVFLWVFAICMVIFAILFTFWMYKKIYNKNIQSIKKGLEELKELQE
jgi:di/tricarboxylate transporter